MNAYEYEVTIAMPVYNVARYLRQTLDAVLAQTFPSLELLVCDDCGTDGSIDIVREYQRQHPRGRHIRIVRQPRNMGIGAARNRLMDEARGRYLYGCDADDLIEPGTIERLYHAAQEHQADMVYGSYDRVYTMHDVEQRREPHVYEHRVFTRPDDYALFAYDGHVQVMTWNFLIRLDIMRANHLRVAHVNYGEDYTFTVDLPTYVDRVVLLPDVTYHYYVRLPQTPRYKQHLSRDEMQQYVDTIDQKKRRTHLANKPYYARRCATLLMYDWSFARQMVAARHLVDPPYRPDEIKHVMWQPMTLGQIMRSPCSRRNNLLAWLLSRLPARLLTWVIACTQKTSPSTNDNTR